MLGNTHIALTSFIRVFYLLWVELTNQIWRKSTKLSDPPFKNDSSTNEIGSLAYLLFYKGRKWHTKKVFFFQVILPCIVLFAFVIIVVVVGTIFSSPVLFVLMYGVSKGDQVTIENLFATFLPSLVFNMRIANEKKKKFTLNLAGTLQSRLNNDPWHYWKKKKASNESDTAFTRTDFTEKHFEKKRLKRDKYEDIYGTYFCFSVVHIDLVGYFSCHIFRLFCSSKNEFSFAST